MGAIVVHPIFYVVYRSSAVRQYRGALPCITIILSAPSWNLGKMLIPPRIGSACRLHKVSVFRYLCERKQTEARTSDAKRNAETHGHEGPVAEAEPLGLGVERDVGERAFGVVVGRRHLCPGRMEASAGNGRGVLGRRANDGSGKHLCN